jgi:hypothetical protein
VSIYDDALPNLKPGEYTEVIREGHKFGIRALDETALQTGRRLYAVRCYRCSENVTDRTSGPLSVIAAHVREAARAQPALENSLQDVAAAVARGEGGISLAAGGNIVLADWQGGALASSKTAVPSPFATLAIGGAVRSVEVEGGVIMATPLDRDQVKRLRAMCDQVLGEAPPERSHIPGFDRIGRLDAVGRRSLWMRHYDEGDIPVIELRAGREGEDARVVIPRTTALAGEIHAVLWAARFAADWEDPRGCAHELEAYGGSLALLAVAEAGIAFEKSGERAEGMEGADLVEAIRRLTYPTK